MKLYFQSILLFLFIGLMACENSIQDINKLNKHIVGREEAKEIEALYTSGGKTKAILTSPLMYRVQDTIAFYEFPQTLAVDFYSENGIKESKLTARYARYTDASSLVFLRDSVKVVHLERGDTLFCDELYWDRNREGVEFYTDKRVRIRRRVGDDLTGKGLEASQDFKSFHIKEPDGLLSYPANQGPQ